MSILVTGATGNIGSVVLEQLAGGEEAVRVMARSPEKIVTKAANVEVVQGDFDDPDSLSRAVEGIDRVFLVSAFSPSMAAQEIAMVEAATAADVQHIVVISAVGADPESANAIGQWLGSIEKAVEESGLPFTILRGASFMQNFLGSADTIRDQGAIYAPAGDAEITWVDTRDIGKVAAAILTGSGHEGQTYTVSGSRLTYAAAAAVIGDTVGSEVSFVDIPGEAALEAMVGAGWPEESAQGLVDLLDAFKNGFQAPLTSVIVDLTGNDPTTFEEFAGDHVELWRKA